MAVNKVVMNTSNGEQTLIDLTSDTVTPETLADGISAHAASGDVITGIMPTTTVLYTEQTLTEAQKAQARENIGAVSEVDVPVKGVDYWTDADQESIVQQVITSLGTPAFGRVDAENNIILTGELADGTYTLVYENSDGSLTKIGTLIVGPQYTNVLDTVGYAENMRVSVSGGFAEVSADGYDLTGYIPVAPGDVIRLCNITMPVANNGYTNTQYWYDSDKNGTGSTTMVPPNYDSVADENSNVVQFKVSSNAFSTDTGYVRINAADINAGSIITINQEIK